MSCLGSCCKPAAVNLNLRPWCPEAVWEVPRSFQSALPVFLHDRCFHCTGIRHMGDKCFQICLASVMGCNWGRLENLIFNVAQHFCIVGGAFLQEEMNTIEGNGGNYRCIFALPLVNEVFSVSHLSNCLIVYIIMCVCLGASPVWIATAPSVCLEWTVGCLTPTDDAIFLFPAQWNACSLAMCAA